MEKTMVLTPAKPTSYVISSPLSGKLVRAGDPILNTRIVRTLYWNGNQEGIKQIFSSDDNGYFSLPAHEEMLELGPLQEFIAKTDIKALIDGVEEDIWYSTKMAKELNSEFDTPPRALVCDLNEPEIGVNIKYGLCLTKCRWENMPEADDPTVP